MEGPWEWRDECEGKLGGKGDLGDKHAREMQGRVKESVEKGRGERERERERDYERESRGRRCEEGVKQERDREMEKRKRV